MTRADLVVAGGGPAGLATAIHAARHGMRVVVVEPRAGPIDKACGEGLMPSALRELAHLGLPLPDGFPLHGIRYVDGNRSVSESFGGPTGLGVRRIELHRALLERARQLSVPIVRDHVTRFSMRDRDVDVHLDGGAPLRADWLVAADGLHSRLRRTLCLDAPASSGRRYGVRRHFASRPWTHHVEVHWADDAEAYVTPVAEDLVGVAILFSGRGDFEHWLTRFPALCQRLGAPVTAARGGGPFEAQVRARLQGRILLVGDAAGFLDPLTGEGVRQALAEARALVDCLSAGRPQDYEGEWRRIVLPAWRLTRILLAASRLQWARRRLVPWLSACPGVFRWGLRILAG